MRLDITSKGHALSDHLKEHIETKTHKLEKYIHGTSEVHVVLERSAHGQLVEINLHAMHKVIHAREAGDTVRACIDKAITKVENQLRKLKEKRTDRKT